MITLPVFATRFATKPAPAFKIIRIEVENVGPTWFVYITSKDIRNGKETRNHLPVPFTLEKAEAEAYRLSRINPQAELLLAGMK